MPKFRITYTAKFERVIEAPDVETLDMAADSASGFEDEWTEARHAGWGYSIKELPPENTDEVTHTLDSYRAYGGVE